MNPTILLLKEESGLKWKSFVKLSKIHQAQHRKFHQNRMKNNKVMHFFRSWFFFVKQFLAIVSLSHLNIWIFKWANWWCHSPPTSCVFYYMKSYLSHFFIYCVYRKSVPHTEISKSTCDLEHSTRINPCFYVLGAENLDNWYFIQ